MQFQEMIAKMAIENLKRQLEATQRHEMRFGWMRRLRRPGSRAHRRWAQARASGRR